MLVLKRGTDQAICIGPDIEITVVETSGKRVRLGIRAPRHVKVLRSELLPCDPSTLHDKSASDDVIESS